MAVKLARFKPKHTLKKQKNYTKDRASDAKINKQLQNIKINKCSGQSTKNVEHQKYNCKFASVFTHSPAGKRITGTGKTLNSFLQLSSIPGWPEPPAKG